MDFQILGVGLLNEIGQGVEVAADVGGVGGDGHDSGIPVRSVGVGSVVVVSQIATVDKSRLLEKIGTLSKEKLAQVIDGSRQVISQKVFD